MMFRIVFWDVLPCKINVVRSFILPPRSGMRLYPPLNRRSKIILHGSTSQKTVLNILILIRSSREKCVGDPYPKNRGTYS
jgi:hypothetical protein